MAFPTPESIRAKIQERDNKRRKEIEDATVQGEELATTLYHRFGEYIEVNFQAGSWDLARCLANGPASHQNMISSIDEEFSDATASLRRRVCLDKLEAHLRATNFKVTSYGTKSPWIKLELPPHKDDQ